VLNKKPHLKTVKEKCNICKKINNCPSCVRTKSSMDG
jgi:hypothetical protein